MTNERKVVAAYFLSLDGVAEKANEFLTGWDDETDAAGEQVIATQDCVLLGRRTYDEWSGFWPTSDIEPFASFVNAAPKYVATSTSLGDAWPNSHAITGDLATFVRDLKTQPGGDIGIHGSISVTRSLLTAGLVDELHLVIAPTVVGTGQKLLDALGPLRLETIHATKTQVGHVLANYRVLNNH
ncbi:dihydrofolate reductase family protein [Kribbella sp.]|uniref:dihydrofolate reductase family protein n=1 Tax=Kribbella sp. TaxID=1871183 RepID=UPI002D31B5D0|nr:dihydrofolate reductase family protein [Kribbella sp.]HZX03670.1 dihydrofolate reductase family protein [Kribbella sp.]